MPLSLLLLCKALKSSLSSPSYFWTTLGQFQELTSKMNRNLPMPAFCAAVRKRGDRIQTGKKLFRDPSQEDDFRWSPELVVVQRSVTHKK